MKILFIGMDNTNYGSPSLEIKMANVLAKNNTVTLCCERMPNFNEEKQYFHRILTMPVNDQPSEKQINKIFEDIYDIIFVSSVSGAPLAAKLKNEMGIPLVTQILDIPSWRLETFYPNFAQQYIQWTKWLMGAAYSDRLIVNHNITKLNLQTLLEYPEEKIKTIYYGIDDVTPNKIKNVEEDNTIVFVSRLVWYKGLKYLIYALRKLENPPTLKIIGMGPEYMYIRRLAPALGVKIKMLGAINDLQKFTEIKKSSFMVYPNISLDIGGLAPLEAGICEKPTIVFDQPVHKEIYESSVEYAKYKNVKNLAEKIRFLIKNEDYRILRGRDAYNFVSLKRTFTHQAKELIKVFKEVLND